jgi:hypothetical protein
MTQRNSSHPPHSIAPRRLALLASAATLGIAVLAGMPAYCSSAWAATGNAIEVPASQTRAPAPGFGDLVAQVKPAFISVRVRFGVVATDATNENPTPFGQSFGNSFQFGFGNIPNLPNLP